MRAIALSLLALLLTLCLLLSSPAFAESNVQAVVCTGDTQPILDVVPDINDTVLRVNVVHIMGTVERVSAVELYVNSEYDHTIAIPANETAFSTAVRLPIGTHTLSVVGVGICGSNATEDGVVTIIPWNYGFLGAQAVNTQDDAPQPDGTNNSESAGETLEELIASSTQERSEGLIGFLQALFPAMSIEDFTFITSFLAAAALPLLPSGVLAQASIGQFIAGRRTLFLAFVPLIGVLFMVVSS